MKIKAGNLVVFGLIAFTFKKKKLSIIIFLARSFFIKKDYSLEEFWHKFSKLFFNIFNRKKLISSTFHISNICLHYVFLVQQQFLTVLKVNKRPTNELMNRILTVGNELTRS